MKSLFFLFLFSFNAFALSVPPLSQPVEDQANILSATEREELNSRLQEIFKTNLVQIGVLIIPSLEGENLEEYSIKVAESWQLGTKEKDNGVLILLAMNDRAIRIEVGSGVEGEITDYFSNQIINNMKPYMRSGEYKSALLLAINSIFEKMEETLPENIAAREEQERKAALKREHDQKQLKEVGSIVGSLFLIALTIWHIGGVFMTKTLLVKTLSETKEEDKKQAVTQTELTSEKIFLHSIKIDPVKLNFAKLLNTKTELKNKKKNLINEINEMKSYLGVK